MGAWDAEFYRDFDAQLERAREESILSFPKGVVAMRNSWASPRTKWIHLPNGNYVAVPTKEEIRLAKKILEVVQFIKEHDFEEDPLKD